MLCYTVLPEEEGRRLREILRGPMRVSYSAMKSAKWNGRIYLNGENAPVDLRVRAGDRVEVAEAEKDPVFVPEPYALPLRIPYEDEYLMVVDKPAPLASQSSARHPSDSLENALYARLGCPEGFIFRPVNRLDKGTSGLMVIARGAHAQDLLQRELHSSDFLREYLALTEGVPSPAEGLLDFPIAKVSAASLRREVSPNGKPARTRYRVVAEVPGGALVRLRLETGRTHQIRVHLSHIGCPVRGDFLYGREDPAFPGRFALHSAYLRLKHPFSGETVEIESIPDFAAEGLRRNAPPAEDGAEFDIPDGKR